MNKVILDASALLALLQHEPGHEEVSKYLAYSLMSTVNVSEVAAILNNVGIPESELKNMISSLIAEIIPFDKEQAFLAAEIKKETKIYGLSLGDRACLALGKINNLPILSADKVWAKLDMGIKIHIIR